MYISPADRGAKLDSCSCCNAEKAWSVEHLWASRFVAWYNHEHRHRGIRFVSPAERHAGEITTSLRNDMRCISTHEPPIRTAGPDTRATGVTAVTLDPQRESVVDAAIIAEKESASAA